MKKKQINQNKKIDDIKLESKAKLEEKEKDFKDRLELEKEKFQLEVEKINNQYELLEIKYEELKEEYSQNFNNK